MAWGILRLEGGRRGGGEHLEICTFARLSSVFPLFLIIFRHFHHFSSFIHRFSSACSSFFFVYSSFLCFCSLIFKCVYRICIVCCVFHLFHHYFIVCFVILSMPRLQGVVFFHRSGHRPGSWSCTQWMGSGMRGAGRSDSCYQRSEKRLLFARSNLPFS